MGWRTNIREIYKIEQTIGRGSFGKVKVCKHRETGKRYAVKVISKDKMTEEDRLNMIFEIQIHQELDHPGVVRLLEVFEDPGHWCLVMDLMQGGELFEQILECEQFCEIDARTCIT